MGRSATIGLSALTFTERLTGVGIAGFWPVRYWLTLTVTRELGGSVTASDGTGTAPPPSLDAWKLRTAATELGLGFWMVTYSTKPGRTVPSAKSHWVPSASAGPDWATAGAGTRGSNGAISEAAHNARVNAVSNRDLLDPLPVGDAAHELDWRADGGMH